MKNLDKPQTIIVTSNKGGSGKTPLCIALVLWALTRKPPLRVLAVDINHTNQDLFQALRNLQLDNERRFETAFTLEGLGTAYYLPISDHLHAVRPREFRPLSPPEILEMIRDSPSSFAQERGDEVFQPDMIVVDGNYCFPSYRMPADTKIGLPAFTFFNIWSITSPHELRIPSAYRRTIEDFRTAFDNRRWDSTHFIHVFSVLEKGRGISSELSRLVRLQREVYTVPGSDDLADLYRKRVTAPELGSEGFAFDKVQREIFSPMLSELESMMTEAPDAFDEDAVNARWVERVNVFLTSHNVFPLNLFPLPHYYPFLRRAVIDMILRRSLTLELMTKMLGAFYSWVAMFLSRYYG